MEGVERGEEGGTEEEGGRVIDTVEGLGWRGTEIEERESREEEEERRGLIYNGGEGLEREEDRVKTNEVRGMEGGRGK